MGETMEACRVADDDPRFKDMPLGQTLFLDGVFLVRFSDWLEFLREFAKASGIYGGGKWFEDEIRKGYH